jgi:D-methionine transport system ATP-binding protein
LLLYHVKELSILIELRHIVKDFGTGDAAVHALRDISLTVEDGEIFGIIGLSGAGKSTLVRCINLLERPTSGSVIVDGRDLTSMTDRELRTARKSISMIFQSFNLLMQRSVLANVCFPMELAGVKKEDARRRAMELLELVELPDKANAYPVQLSGGQKQRVAIARALASDPKVLLCDEATSALDPKTTRSILALLKKLNRELGVTVVVITHEMRVVEQICSRVAILDNGEIQETGPVAEVFSNPRSEAGRRLVLPEGEKIHVLPDNRLVRLVFNGASATEPIIATLASEQGIRLNILSADTRSIGEKTFGNMILGLPEDETEAARALLYLREINGVTAEEVTDYVQ